MPFHIFVPTAAPVGLAPQPPRSRDQIVEILYLTKEQSIGLRVTNGPAGCCLDSDPGKAVGETLIRNGLTGHFLINQPEFGGPILWWQEGGTYIALSGPDLTKTDLLTVANSMSSTALLTER